MPAVTDKQLPTEMSNTTKSSPAQHNDPSAGPRSLPAHSFVAALRASDAAFSYEAAAHDAGFAGMRHCEVSPHLLKGLAPPLQARAAVVNHSARAILLCAPPSDLRDAAPLVEALEGAPAQFAKLSDMARLVEHERALSSSKSEETSGAFEGPRSYLGGKSWAARERDDSWLGCVF